jgi:short-chain fatty acids transporter
LLTLLTGAMAWQWGSFPAGGVAGGAVGAGSRAAQVVDAWRGPGGVWRFLPFAMQMCLILVTGHALAESRPVRGLIRAMARLPRSGAGAAALVSLVAMGFGLVNWGLGLIVGALFARDVARELTARGVAVHAPLLAAAGYTGMVIWHAGLSGSAPILMTSAEQAAAVLPAETIARMTAGGAEGGVAAIPLGRTVFSAMNLVVVAGVLVTVPCVLAMLSPRRDDPVTPMPLEDDLFEDPEPRVRTVPDWLETTPLVPVLLAGLIVWAMVRFATASGQPWASTLLTVGPNELNLSMLALGLLAHGSVRSYIASAERGARGCAGIILQFPLYAGIMGMLAASGLIARFSDAMAASATPGTLPLLTFLSACVVNLFVPSGGGQWAIQGPIALEAGQAMGVAPEKMVMAVAYGDQLTNMLQPFWALPLLAITGVKAREIVGYTALVMLAAGAWMAVGLVVL